jgi:hypothetical protein
MIGAIRQQCSRVGTLGSRAMSSGSISLAEEIKEMKKWKVCEDIFVYTCSVP